MSFQLSPEAVIYDLGNQIREFELKIPNLQLRVDNFKTILDEGPQFISGAHWTQNVTYSGNLKNLSSAETDLINNQQEIDIRQNQIKILEVDAEAKRVEIPELDLSGVQSSLTNLNEDTQNILSNFQESISKLTESLSNFKPQAVNPDFPKPGQTDEKSNLPIIAAALIVGALIL